jgi:hypothetical protein
VLTDKWRLGVLKRCGIPQTSAQLKSHRDIFLIAGLDDDVFKKLEELLRWYQSLEDPSVLTKKRSAMAS